MDVMTSTTVFGMDVWTQETLPCLQGASALPTGRVLDVAIDPRRDMRDWPPDARPISAQQAPDGTFAVRIDAHDEAGYQLQGPRYGRHIISLDGRRLRCLPEGSASGDWQRFLVGQVLPFAAALNELEVLHASAVSLGGRAIALLGPSGAGKTSLALALCRCGGEFLADDVVALERWEGELLVHPGTPLAGITHAEAARIGVPLAPGPALAVNERERLVRVAPRRSPAPLSALLFLQRLPEGPSEPLFQRSADAGALLSSTFNFVLDDPARLERLLDVCALAAARVVARVSCGPRVDADALAAAIAGWLERLR